MQAYPKKKIYFVIEAIPTPRLGEGKKPMAIKTFHLNRKQPAQP